MPIKLIDRTTDFVELEITLQYEYDIGYDEKNAHTIKRNQPAKIKTKIFVPIKTVHEPIRVNKYANRADGKAMQAKDRDMFFGRDRDIQDVIDMIFDTDGQMKQGSIVAMYGQKRCGKSSLMNFLGMTISYQCPQATVIGFSVQGIKFGASADVLKVSEIFADEAQTYRRVRPRAQGRMYKRLKRTSHLTVKVAKD